MKINYAPKFRKDYSKLSKIIQGQADKKLKIFIQNKKHPLLRVHKIKSTKNIFEGSVNKNYRFTFCFIGGVCILRRIGPHKVIDKTLNT